MWPEKPATTVRIVGRGVRTERMDKIFEIAEAIADCGGRAYLVGGAVRDEIMGLPSKDIDIEVFGVSMSTLRSVLSEFGNVCEVGQHFGVFHIEKLDLDVSLPRKDSKVGVGHRGFEVDTDPDMTIEEAARRRDLTINAISVDLLSGEIIDPFGGIEDIENRILRATDPATFGDDPLRALRVMQFAARFDFEVEHHTMNLVASQCLEELPKERIWAEFEKLMLKGKVPSKGIEVLRRGGTINFFPQLGNIRGIHQDPYFHPEGDVYTHTLMVLDEAAKLRRDDPAYDLPLMFGALCHDFGKVTHTEEHDNGRVTSHGHEEAGWRPARSFMYSIGAPGDLSLQVQGLVANHLRPHLMAGVAKGAGYRRLGRDLDGDGVSFGLLADVSRADALGRDREVDLSQQDLFMEEAHKYVLDSSPTGKVHDTVMGRHLLERGMREGPDVGRFLSITQHIEDETDIKDVDELIRLANLFLVEVEDE